METIVNYMDKLHLESAVDHDKYDSHHYVCIPEIGLVTLIDVTNNKLYQFYEEGYSNGYLVIKVIITQNYLYIAYCVDNDTSIINKYELPTGNKIISLERCLYLHNMFEMNNVIVCFYSDTEGELFYEIMDHDLVCLRYDKSFNKIYNYEKINDNYYAFYNEDPILLTINQSNELNYHDISKDFNYCIVHDLYGQSNYKIFIRIAGSDIYQNSEGDIITIIDGAIYQINDSYTVYFNNNYVNIIYENHGIVMYKKDFNAYGIHDIHNIRDLSGQLSHNIIYSTLSSFGNPPGSNVIHINNSATTHTIVLDQSTYAHITYIMPNI